jgi:hypothetical protein
MTVDQAPAAPAEGHLPPQTADHFRRLEGARAVGTLAALETEEFLTEAIDEGCILCIHGHVGLGKTFSVHTALRQLAPDTTIRLVFDEAPKKNEVLEALWRALALPGEPDQAEPHSQPPGPARRRGAESQLCHPGVLADLVGRRRDATGPRR